MLAGRPSNTPLPETPQELAGADLLARLDRVDVLSRKMFAGKLPGERRSKKRGRSVEFDDYRQYAPGDDLRHIDWNVFARLDRFFIKLFLEDEDLGVHLVVDATPSMDAGEGGRTPTKKLYAHRLAMAMAYVGLVHNNRVTTTVLGRDKQNRNALAQLAPLRGRRSVAAVGGFLLETLREPIGEGRAPARMIPMDTKEAPLAAGIESAMRTRVGKGVVVVISDFLEPEWLVDNAWDRTLNALSAGGTQDPVCLQVLSPSELDPSLDASLSGDLRLTDAETGLSREVTVSPKLLRDHTKRMRAYIDRFASACAARSIDHALVTTDTDPAGLLLGRMRRRGLIG